MNTLRTTACLVLLSGIAGNACPAESAAAHLADQPVYTDEYTFYADQLRTKVASRIMREHGVDQSAGFWSSRIDGVCPEEVLKAEVLCAIARARAIQELALRQGILDEVKSYRQLVTDFHGENQRREEMKARGEIFYGPVRFRQEVWFEVWFRQVEKALQRHALQAMQIPGPGPKEEAAAAEQVEKEIHDAVTKLLEN